MTQDVAVSAGIPEWSFTDRLRKAREHANLKQAELADEIGISRSSLSGYEQGRPVPKPVITVWALRTGVPIEWLRDGIVSTTTGPGGTSSSRCIPPWVASVVDLDDYRAARLLQTATAAAEVESSTVAV